MNLIQLDHSIFAIARDPIKHPDVGTIRFVNASPSWNAVSYTHLDVYKRQAPFYTYFSQKNRCIRFTFILHIYFKLYRFIMSNAYIEFCFMPEKH